MVLAVVLCVNAKNRLFPLNVVWRGVAPVFSSRANVGTIQFTNFANKQKTRNINTSSLIRLQYNQLHKMGWDPLLRNLQKLSNKKSFERKNNTKNWKEGFPQYVVESTYVSHLPLELIIEGKLRSTIVQDYQHLK